ncbi:MAG: ATP-binding protein, partial [Bacteroidales bacterium]|nr:ATP-binding protein [Bacteroidales bacterium]
WYLTVEPVEGWAFLKNMNLAIWSTTLFLLILLVGVYFMMSNLQMSRNMERLQLEEQRMRELKQHQQELMAARDAAESANRSKTLFLNNMSHDIRTPMNAILGFAALLDKHKENPELVKDYLKKITESGEYLLSIINNTLDLARIDSGRVLLDEAVCDMRDSRSSLLNMFEALIEKKHLHFYDHVDVKHRYLIMDKIKVQQILVNLISNAIKYTPDGGQIDFIVEEKPSQRDGYITYVTTVKDNGIGMSKDFLEHIFEYFSRERNTTESKVVGSGLGMSIVKKLVELMGGTIEIESELGKGTTVTVTIEHRYVEESEVKPQEDAKEHLASVEGQRILLAEDNELNAEIAITILEEAGFSVDHASDGAECVKMLAESAAGYYDLILMDIQMPLLNGYDATRRIRQLEDASKANIPIVAMTANAFEEDRQLAYDAGMNDYLSKPVNVSQLMTILSKILS